MYIVCLYSSRNDLQESITWNKYTFLYCKKVTFYIKMLFPLLMYTIKIYCINRHHNIICIFLKFYKTNYFIDWTFQCDFFENNFFHFTTIIARINGGFNSSFLNIIILKVWGFCMVISHTMTFFFLLHCHQLPHID